MASDTFLQQRGVRMRMKCNGQVANIIANTFTTAEQLVAAVKSDTPLTEYDGIGPTTAETIEEWWDNRFEREKQMPGSSMEKTSTRSATICLHNSWADALGMEGDDGE